MKTKTTISMKLATTLFHAVVGCNFLIRGNHSHKKVG